MEMHESLNVYGEPLETCCDDPVTGFYRDGCCNTNDQDLGMHTVCVVVTDAFLAFSKQQGNDLSTPAPEYDFPGLQAGDRWCLCALRWLEAQQADMAPKVCIQSTHQRTLEVIDIHLLRKYAVDLQ